MICYVIGAHGSGKSTAVHAIMRGKGDEWKPEFVSGRAAPIGYRKGKVLLAGRYDIPNGGTDTIRPLSQMAEYLRNWSRRGDLVLGEGVGQARFVEELIRISKSERVIVYALSTDLRTCISSVHKRGHRLSDEGVKRSWIRCRNAATELVSGGIPVHDCTRKSLAETLRKEIQRCC